MITQENPNKNNDGGCYDIHNQMISSEFFDWNAPIREIGSLDPERGEILMQIYLSDQSVAHSNDILINATGMTELYRIKKEDKSDPDRFVLFTMYGVFQIWTSCSKSYDLDITLGTGHIQAQFLIEGSPQHSQSLILNIEELEQYTQYIRNRS